MNAKGRLFLTSFFGCLSEKDRNPRSFDFPLGGTTEAEVEGADGCD
jgi:hypothetical protein